MWYMWEYDGNDIVKILEWYNHVRMVDRGSEWDNPERRAKGEKIKDIIPGNTNGQVRDGEPPKETK